MSGNDPIVDRVAILFEPGTGGPKTRIIVGDHQHLVLSRPEWYTLASVIVQQFGGTLEEYKGFRIIAGNDVREVGAVKPTLPENTLHRTHWLFGEQIGKKCSLCGRVHWRKI